MERRNDETRLIADTLDEMPVRLTPLAGGCVASVYAVDRADGSRVVAKVDASARPRLDVEGFMLSLLRGRSPLTVPEVIRSTPRVLVMEFVEHRGGASDEGRVELAEGLAALHANSGDAFGLDRDTLIGPLEQPNGRLPSWREFYAERRIRHFARVAADSGHLPTALRGRCLRAADRLHAWIDDDEPPTLVHGDLWSGNVLWRNGRLAAVIDPALHYADREVELAFMDLFGSFGEAFWGRYHAVRPIRDGFWELRRHAYRLFPLLVHVTLFGESYLGALSRELDALGIAR